MLFDKYNHFTHYNLCLFLYNIYYNNRDYLYAINTCFTWIIFFGFHSACIFDNNAFKKLRKKQNRGFINFHILNFITHIYPFFYVLIHTPNIIRYRESIDSLLIYLLWCYISTYGTMDLSNIYVKLHNNRITYNKLHIVSCVSCIICPYYYF